MGNLELLSKTFVKHRHHDFEKLGFSSMYQYIPSLGVDVGI